MIEFTNATKKYGTLTAVESLNLTIQRGEFFALLGPNGAGKTTTLRMASSLTEPTLGQIAIGGEDVRRSNTALKKLLGIVPQYSNLEGELSARQNLSYHGRLYGLDKRVREKRIGELLEFAGLQERADDKARMFSGGMQRKLMIAKALMHEPSVMLLDEPTVGLDASWRRRIWDLLRSMNRDGLTILMTTHYIEEAHALAGRVGMMHGGCLAQCGTPEAIIASAGEWVLDIFADGQTRSRFFESRDAALAEAARLKLAYTIRPANLEDAFILMTDRRITDEAV